jgi:hypothetical protein
MDSRSGAAKPSNWDQAICLVVFNPKWCDLQGFGKPDTAFSINVEEQLQRPARMSSLQSRNEKASACITPCAKRRSHFYRAKFIP